MSAPEKAVVLEWLPQRRRFRWVRGADLPMSHFDAERRAAELSDAGGHFMPVPLSRLESKPLLAHSAF